GRRRTFELPLAPEGTPFQMRVWNALLEIPYGETISYGELAARIGDRSASRAVGLANGSNPLPIVIPCHRVIGSNGKLTGYGGGRADKGRAGSPSRALARPDLFSPSSDPCPRGRIRRQTAWMALCPTARCSARNRSAAR